MHGSFSCMVSSVYLTSSANSVVGNCSPELSWLVVPLVVLLYFVDFIVLPSSRTQAPTHFFFFFFVRGHALFTLGGMFHVSFGPRTVWLFRCLEVVSRCRYPRYTFL